MGRVSFLILRMEKRLIDQESFNDYDEFRSI